MQPKQSRILRISIRTKISRTKFTSSIHVYRFHSYPISVSEKEHMLICTRAGFNPLACSQISVKQLSEAPGPRNGIAAVVGSHDGLDRFGGPFGMIKRNGGDVVVEDVCVTNSVKKVSTNES
jgi:hypothetical protein